MASQKTQFGPSTSRSLDLPLNALAWGFPALVLAALGLLLGIVVKAPFGVPFFTVLVWTGVFIVWGWLKQEPQEWLVVERFGTYHAMKRGGISFVVPLVNSPIAKGSFKRFSLSLFVGESIDFTDGSAPITATAWLQIGNLADLEAGNIPAVMEQVGRFVYRYTDPLEHARVALESVLRPKLQTLSIDQAQKKGHEVTDSIQGEVGLTLAEAGLYLRDTMPVMIDDVKLPPEIIAQRAKRLEGETSAQEAAAAAKGPINAIRAIQKGSVETGGKEITFEEAREIYFREKTLSTLGETGANISMVASDMGGVTKMMDVSPGGKGK